MEPIFSSDDIVKQMPEEGQKFMQVDTSFTELMAIVVDYPAVIPIARNEDHLDLLQRCEKLLDEVQKGLAAYLEKKRLFFPRFFFLSNDEMLEVCGHTAITPEMRGRYRPEPMPPFADFVAGLQILSETKDPTRVQPHLKKCFEGIQKLRFAPDLSINAMISAEGEQVPLKSVISTKNANGKVEEWLLQVEEVMFDSIHDVTRKVRHACRRISIMVSVRNVARSLDPRPHSVCACVTRGWQRTLQGHGRHG